jgi:hypothetical protein
MSLSRQTKLFSTIASTLGLIAVSNLVLIDSAKAFSVTFQNNGFEDPIVGSQNDWNTIGDVTTTGTIDGIVPTNAAKQAIITTGYLKGDYADPIGNRDDDSDFNFNQSGTNPVSADTNPDADALQTHFGFNTDAFSIDRVGGISGIGPRTSKEGSGMYQQFNVTLGSGETGFSVKFNWAYLTNDGSTTFGGEQDFAFWSLGRINGTTYTTALNNSNPNDEIDVLKSSSGSINAPIGNNNYGEGFNYISKIYSVSGLTAGTYTYRVGFGVVDVDGLDSTSALMLDNIEVIPFEFSPSAGIGLVLGLIGVNKLRRRFSLSKLLAKI